MPLVDSFSVLKNVFPFHIFLPVRYFHKFSEISNFADVDLVRQPDPDRIPHKGTINYAFVDPIPDATARMFLHILSMCSDCL